MTGEDLATELERILAALEIIGPGVFRLGHGPLVQVAPEQGAAVLASSLYTNCYAHRFPGPPAATPWGADPSHAARLDAAVRSVERWDTGWRVYGAHPDGSLGVIKGETQRLALPGQYLAQQAHGGVPAVGETVALWMPRSSATLQSAFHFAFGETPADRWDEAVLVRFYFNTTPPGVPDLLAWVTGTLNAYRIAFRMKALVDPALYTRSDAAVLYVARRHATIVARLLAEPDCWGPAGLDDPVPLFTLRFAPGIGIAEEPGTGESFGMHRCRLLAEALLGTTERGAAQRMAAVRARFAAEGLDLDRPWMSPAHTDIYSDLTVAALAA